MTLCLNVTEGLEVNLHRILLRRIVMRFGAGSNKCINESKVMAFQNVINTPVFSNQPTWRGLYGKLIHFFLEIHLFSFAIVRLSLDDGFPGVSPGVGTRHLESPECRLQHLIPL